MDIVETDVVVIGAGIAGASAAAALAAGRRVVLVEAEEQAGFHSTGRSAAMWILNYGPADVQALTGASRGFFAGPPAGFAEAPLLSRRAVVFLAPPEQEAELHRLLSEGTGLREIGIGALRASVPALRPGYAAAAAIEEDAFDIDVAALHAGFLRQMRAAGGTIRLRSRAGRIGREGGQWEVACSDGTAVRAPIVVNAAGAWGDAVAEAAGVAPLGLQPKRRTGCIIDPGAHAVQDWPLLNDVDHTWYLRPEARAKLMVSPADETDLAAQDVQPDELDVAVAIDRMQAAMDLEVRRVEHSWAGLRTFTPDRSLAIGWDGAADGFFWCVGQGGYGIQTAPAAGQLVAALVDGRAPMVGAAAVAAMDPARFGSAGDAHAGRA